MIRHNKLRIGNFTSGGIVDLTSLGKRDMTEAELAARPKKGKGSSTTTIQEGLGDSALTYIDEANMERRLGRTVDGGGDSKHTLWGKLVEQQCFDKLPTSYIITSQVTKQHPEIDYWVGSKDGYKYDPGGTIFDIKSPFTLPSFCRLVAPLYDGIQGMEIMECLRKGWTDSRGMKHKPHPDAETYYFQLVSNACIDDCRFAELIVYMPYKSELAQIRQLAERSETPEKYYWLTKADDEDLPYLIDGGYYKNLNIIRFAVPETDKEFLTGRVREAGKLLVPRPVHALIAEYKPKDEIILVTE